MSLQDRVDTGMNDEGDVLRPTPFSGRSSASYRRSTSPQPSQSRTPATPSVRHAQVVQLPLFQNPYIAGIAEKHGFSQSQTEVNMLDSTIRTFTRMGFQVVDPHFNAVTELKRTDDVSGQVVTVRITRVISRIDSLPKWKMAVSSSDRKYFLNSFPYPPEQFKEFAMTYATRFQINSVTPLDLDL